MPNSQGLSGKNKIGFNYTSKRDFVGKDKFRYTAIVKDSENPDNIEMWCRTDADVTVYVKPKSPVVTSFIEACCSEDEGEIKLTWPSVNGAESYFVYKYNTSTTIWDKVSTVESDENTGVYSYSEEPSEWSNFKDVTCDGDDTSTLSLKYKVSATKEMDGKTFESDSNEVNPIMTCCTPLVNPTVGSSQSGFCSEALDIKGVVTLTWSAVSGADYYNVYRRGSYTGSTTDEYKFVGRVEGSLEFKDTVDGCVGCSSENVKYDYYVSPVEEEFPDCNVIASAHTVTIDCCNTTPKARNQSFKTDYEKNLTGQQLDAWDWEENITTYTIGTPSSGTIENFNASTGTFDYVPVSGFYGDATITWTATDACSDTSNTGTVTITVNPPADCLEYDYIICNANIPWLSHQQDTIGVRQKITSLEQVPFFLNTKGVPSLRRRCGAYTVTRGLNPSFLALADDDCEFGP